MVTGVDILWSLVGGDLLQIFKRLCWQIYCVVWGRIGQGSLIFTFLGCRLRRHLDGAQYLSSLRIISPRLFHNVYPVATLYILKTPKDTNIYNIHILILELCNPQTAHIQTKKDPIQTIFTNWRKSPLFAFAPNTDRNENMILTVKRALRVIPVNHIFQ